MYRRQINIKAIVAIGASLLFSSIAVATHSIDSKQIAGSGGIDGNQLNTQYTGPSIEMIKAHLKNRYFVVLKQPGVMEYSQQRSHFQRKSSSTQSIQNSAVPKFNPLSSENKSYRAQLIADQILAKQELGNFLGRSLKTYQNYELIFNGFTADLNADEIERLQKHNKVKFIQKVEVHRTLSDTGPSDIGANNVWQAPSNNQGEGIVVAVLDTGIVPDHPSFAATDGNGETITYSGSYKGVCTTVAGICNDKLIGVVVYKDVVDIVKAAEVLQSAPSLTQKIETGYDFDGHGTHVAGTAVGNVVLDVPVHLSVNAGSEQYYDRSDYNFAQISGVAPKAHLIAYQTCIPLGSPDEAGCLSNLAAASVEHAIDNGVDVINYSVGGFASSPWQNTGGLAFLQAREAGIHVAVAAGNSGPEASTISTPGNSPWVTSVGAVSHGRYFSNSVVSTSGGNGTINLEGAGGTNGVTDKEVVYASTYGDAGCLNTLNSGVADKIVVCLRGDIARVAKGINAKAGGAAGMILVNVAGGPDTINGDNHVLPAVHLNVADAASLSNWFQTEARASIAGGQLSSEDQLRDKMAFFSSRGQGEFSENLMLPSVVAPGSEIFAANTSIHPYDTSAQNTDYTFLSGTSMASPHVAGALALIAKAKPEWSPAEAQSALMMSAYTGANLKDLDWFGDGSEIEADIFTRGSGRIQVDNAISAGLVMDESIANYQAANPSGGSIDQGELNIPALVANNCIQTCSWTRTFNLETTDQWNISYEGLDPTLDLQVSPSTINGTAGSSVTVTITATKQSGTAPEWAAGEIRFTPQSSGTSILHIPVAAKFVSLELPKLISLVGSDASFSTQVNNVSTDGGNLSGSIIGMVKPVSFNDSVTNDSSSDNLFDGSEEINHHEFTIDSATRFAVVDLEAAIEGRDLDLFIVSDADGNGEFSEVDFYGGLRCISGREDSNEQCILTDYLPGTYFAIVHGYDTAGQVLNYKISISKVTDENDPSNTVTVTSNGNTANIALTVSGYVENGVHAAFDDQVKYYGELAVAQADGSSNPVTSIISVDYQGEGSSSDLPIPKSKKKKKSSIPLAMLLLFGPFALIFRRNRKYKA